MNQKDAKSRVAEEIDRNLRRAFDDLASEPVPDKFTQLLAQLKAKEAGEESGSGGDTSNG